MRIPFLVMAASLMLLSACATVGMRDGRRSILIDDDLAFRENLNVIRNGEPPNFGYHPLPPCQLNIEGAPARTLGTISDRTELVDQVSVSVRQVRGRYIVSIVDGGGRASTLAISALGERSDYNLSGVLSHRGRVADGDPSETSQRYADGTSRSVEDDAFYRRYQFLVPEYSQASGAPGDIVGSVRNVDGSAWAMMRYQGLVGPLDRRHALIDLVAETSRGEEVLMGYLIVDLPTMLPRNVTVWDGTRLKISMRTNCFSTQQ